MSTMKFVKPVSILLMAISACLSIWFVSVLKPASTGAFISFAAWLLSPYVVLSAALVFLRSKHRPSFHWFVVAALVSIGGILLLSDVIFWHKDAQGAIAVILVPLFQGAAFAVLLPFAKWVSRYVRA